MAALFRSLRSGLRPHTRPHARTGRLRGLSIGRHAWTRTALALLLWVPLVLGGLALAQDQAAPARADRDSREHGVEPKDPFDILFTEIDSLQRTVDTLRLELAAAKLETAAAQRELDELRQFIRDHREYGRDFEQYEAVKATSRREGRKRQAEASRLHRETERAERTNRQREARAERESRVAEFRRVERYRNAGFKPLGFDVFLGPMAFHYDTTGGYQFSR